MKECVFKIQHFDNIRQEWNDWFKTREYRYFQEAIVTAEQSRKRMERRNIIAERDWTDKGHGSFDIPPMRIVKVCDGEVVRKMPATAYDMKMYKDYAMVYER